MQTNLLAYIPYFFIKKEAYETALLSVCLFILLANLRAA
jgi:hypothetical protein